MCCRILAFRAALLVLHDEVWVGLLLMFGFASLLIVSTRTYLRFWVPLTGIVLTLLAGWTWWRISTTFYAFLRDYNDYGKSAVSEEPRITPISN